MSHEPIVPPVDSGVPRIPSGAQRNVTSPVRRVHIAANTAAVLKELGEDIDETVQDVMDARTHFTENTLPDSKEIMQRPALAIRLGAMLDEYDNQAIADAGRIRTYLTNRLIEESDDEKPTVRLKALELLGKLTDVGAFMERSEVTVNNKSTEELEFSLREKIERILGRPIEGEVVND